MKAQPGQIIETIDGPATVAKVYGNIVTAELRERPKIKQPRGEFYEKRIFQYPLTEYHKARIAEAQAARMQQ